MTPLLVASNILLWVLVITLCGVSLTLIRALGSLNEQLAENRRAAVPSILGQKLPDVILTDESGSAVPFVNPSQEPGVVFVLGEGCDGCVRLVRETHDEIAAAVERGVPVAAIVMTSGASPAERIRNNLDLPRRVQLFRDSDGSTAQTWQIQVTPQVMVVKGGIVKFLAKAPSADWVRKELSNYTTNGSDESRLIPTSMAVLKEA